MTAEILHSGKPPKLFGVLDQSFYSTLAVVADTQRVASRLAECFNESIMHCGQLCLKHARTFKVHSPSVHGHTVSFKGR